jgi:hypothetical protein
MRESKKWKDIKRVIGINIHGSEKSASECMRHYKMHEQLHHSSHCIDGIEIIQYSLMHTPQSLKDKEKNDWFTFFKKASCMTEKDVQKKISTPAVLEAFERVKLSTLPDHVREMYAKQEAQYAQYSIHTQEVVEKGIAELRTQELIEKGIAEGIADLRTQELIEKGIAEGIADLRTQELIEKGIAEGRADILINLIQKMKGESKSDKKIKKRLSLSDEEFQEYMRIIEA